MIIAQWPGINLRNFAQQAEMIDRGGFCKSASDDFLMTMMMMMMVVMMMVMVMVMVMEIGVKMMILVRTQNGAVSVILMTML